MSARLRRLVSQSVSQAQNVRRLPESLLLPTLDLPPRDGRALLRLVGDLGDMAGVGYGWMRRGNARGGRRQGAFTSRKVANPKARRGWNGTGRRVLRAVSASGIAMRME
jgi:hypothetical protein